MKNKAIVATLLSALMFGLSPVIAKQVFNSGVNVLTMVFLRNLLALPFLALLIRFNKLSFKIDKALWLDLLGLTVFGQAMTTLLAYSAYAYISTGMVTTLHFLFPVFITLIYFVFYHEKIHWAQWLTLLLALGGTLGFMDLSHRVSIIGFVCAIGSALTYAFYFIRIDKSRLKAIHPYQLSFYLSLLSSIIIGSIAFGTQSFIMPAFNSWILILIVSMLTSFLGVVLLQVGIKGLGALNASILCLLEPITSIIAGIIIYKEPFSAFILISSVLILSSVGFLIYSQRKS
jgi:drug/metabolite transporter (DMT)-like permease